MDLDYAPLYFATEKEVLPMAQQLTDEQYAAACDEACQRAACWRCPRSVLLGQHCWHLQENDLPTR